VHTWVLDDTRPDSRRTTIRTCRSGRRQRMTRIAITVEAYEVIAAPPFGIVARVPHRRATGVYFTRQRPTCRAQQGPLRLPRRKAAPAAQCHGDDDGNAPPRRWRFHRSRDAQRGKVVDERAKNAYYTARGHAGGPTAPAKIARVEAARIAYEAAKARCRGGPVLEAPSEA
jgi:hypothetical protein